MTSSSLTPSARRTFLFVSEGQGEGDCFETRELFLFRPEDAAPRFGVRCSD